jgi:hypothetical protein
MIRKIHVYMTKLARELSYATVGYLCAISALLGSSSANIFGGR